MSASSDDESGGNARHSAAPIDAVCTSESLEEDAPELPPAPPSSRSHSGAMSVTECGVYLCARCCSKRSAALGAGPSKEVLADVAVRYVSGSYIPDVMGELAEPFQTLRFMYDKHEKRLREQLMSRVTSAQQSEHAQASPRGKKLSLRRKGKKSAPATSADEAFALEQIESLVLVRAEVAQMVKRLEAAHDTFVDALIELVGLRDAQQQRELTVFSVYAMLDTTVGTHPLLADLKLCDNKYFVEIGRSLVQAHIYAYSLAQGRPLEAAMRRYKQVIDNADVWLTERFKRRAREMMPVMWRLRVDTHEQITDDDLKYVERRVMRGTPLIMIALLHILRLRAQRDQVLKELFFHFF